MGRNTEKITSDTGVRPLLLPHLKRPKVARHQLAASTAGFILKKGQSLCRQMAKRSGERLPFVRPAEASGLPLGWSVRKCKAMSNDCGAF